MSFILTDFRPLSPRFRVSQGAALDWLAAAHERAESRNARENGPFDFGSRLRLLLRRFGCSPEKIGHRGSALEDFTHQDWEKMRLFSPQYSAAGAPLSERNRVFQEAAIEAFDQWYPKEAGGEQGRSVFAERAPSELIHVTCTGYLAPSAAQLSASTRGWLKDTRVTHAYHMGCYAAVPAIRLAAAALSLPQGLGHASRGRVDVAHTEFCTLHFRPERHEPEQLVVQSLFADGLIRYSVVMGEDFSAGESAMEILAIREEQVEASSESMTWVPEESGMAMTLARDVPEKISRSLESYLVRLFAQVGLDFATEKHQTVFAVHPGGPRIIDGVLETLGLEEAQVKWSRKVLFERGNLSSATLPHIWWEILQDESVSPGVRVVSLAFGPGLTIAGCLLKKRGGSE